METHDKKATEWKESYPLGVYDRVTVAATQTMNKQFDTDPYDLDLPSEWDYAVEGGRVDYVNDESTVRVSITEFPRHLQVYWWVDMYTRENAAADWVQREAGLGDSFRNPEDAVRVAEVLVESVEEGDDLTELPVIDIA